MYKKSRKIKISLDFCWKVTGKNLTAHRSKSAKRTKGNPVRHPVLRPTRIRECTNRIGERASVLVRQTALVGGIFTGSSKSLARFKSPRLRRRKGNTWEIPVKISARSEERSDSCVARRKHLVRSFTIHKVNVPPRGRTLLFFSSTIWTGISSLLEPKYRMKKKSSHARNRSFHT